MSISKTGNEPVIAYHLVTQISGKKYALFTINRLELNQTMFDYIQETPEVLFWLQQYETTKFQFTADLQKLIQEGFKNGGELPK